MATLKWIYVLHSTDPNHEDAGSDSNFELIATRKSGQGDYRKRFSKWPGSRHDEREKGRTDEYRFDVTDKGITTESQLKIRIIEEDGWLPCSMWAIGLTESNEFVVLASRPNWDRGWINRGSDIPKEEEEVLISN